MNEVAPRTPGGDGTGMPDHAVINRTCAKFETVPAAFRRDVANGPASEAGHLRCAAKAGVLWNIELGKPPAPAPEPFAGAIKVAFWNLERCRHVEESARVLAAANADINLLCELDAGMARTSQRHTPRDLAASLNQGYAFGVEFIELGLGDLAERTRHAGEENTAGLHGNAILSPARLKRPQLIRFKPDGRWFDGSHGERRLGSRIALAVTLPVAGRDIAIVNTHLESHRGPERRTSEMRALLAAVDRYADGGPVILAGDFNTSTAPRDQIRNPAARAALLASDPGRLINPVPHEPLFEVAAAAGFDWHACNLAGPTQRGHVPPRFERRLDWFFTRGLVARDPATISATSTKGVVLSDHDLITTMIVHKDQK